MATTFRPLISTAQIRGLIKKNKISYVDATRRNYSCIANGLTVWQLCDNVYVRAYGKDSELYVESLNNLLNEYGLILQSTNDQFNTLIIAKVGA